jgi:hypothetical protein
MSCMYLASLYDGALILLTTGRIGISFLCIFSFALSIGGVGLSCVKYFAFCLPMSVVCFWIKFCISLLYLSVGSLWIILKLLLVRKVLILSLNSLLWMTTVVFLCPPVQSWHYFVVVSYIFVLGCMLVFYVYCLPLVCREESSGVCCMPYVCSFPVFFLPVDQWLFPFLR